MIKDALQRTPASGWLLRLARLPQRSAAGHGPSGEPGVSGDFWGSQEGCQGPQVGLLALSLGQGLPGGPQATMGLVSVGLPASTESAIMIKEGGDEHRDQENQLDVDMATSILKSVDPQVGASISTVPRCRRHAPSLCLSSGQSHRTAGSCGCSSYVTFRDTRVM